MTPILRWIRIVRSRLSVAFARGDLHSILVAADPSKSLLERVAWLESLIEWIRLPASLAEGDKTDRIQSSRLKFMLHFLERYPELKTSVSNTLQSILVESDVTSLLTDAGIDVEHAFTKELADRLTYSLIPKFSNPRELRIIFEHVFQADEDVDWLKTLTKENYAALVALLFPSATAKSTFHENFLTAAIHALNTLNIRLCGLAISAEVRERLPPRPQKTSPFFQLQRVFAALVISTPQKDFQGFVNEHLKLALADINSVYPHLEESGVSIDLVYKLDAMKAIIHRVEVISAAVFANFNNSLNDAITKNLIQEIAKDTAEKDSLAAFLGSNINLIARKIVERTSETGEHYITKTKEDYRSMFKSAAGGGIVTVFTTVFKTVIGKMGLPLFFDGFFTALNYSLSFIFIQLNHLTLATKTPAMTASTLAAKLKHLDTEEEAHAFVEEVVCLVRSAFVAVLGNLGLVVPGAILFDIIYFTVTGSHLFKPDYSIEQMKIHNPFLSLTLIYAAVTGLILWLSSVLGAWVDNWFVYRKQFEVFESSDFFRKFLGKPLHQSFAGFLRKNLSGFATNIALGFMLAFSGVWGKFFGLPIQVRHVTLSAGTLSFALQGLENLREHLGLIAGAVFGVFVIGLLNFGVSFSLSLFVAARARNVRLSQFPFLIGRILKRFKESPKDFFWA